MIYTVGEIAKKLNVAPSTIRYYDKEGLLPFVERSTGGIRMFHDEDMDWLNIIECLKHTGMPIKEIKHFIDCCLEGDATIPERLAIIKAQRNLVLRQIEDMQRRLNMLDRKTWFDEKAKEAGTCDVYRTMPREEVPLEYQHYLADRWDKEDGISGKEKVHV